ncbi:MAG: hybrid sensor histidine kinase/response regulator [Balneolaceae bacterium]
MSDKTLNILIAEDSKEDADLLIHLLRKNGLDLHYYIVDEKREMQKQLENQEFDLVISDYKMSGFTGMDALKLTKKSDPMLPFILLSGFIDQEQEVKILEHGANEVLMKNNLNRLPFAVRRVLHEISDKKKLQKLIHTKDKLFSVLAHDLRGTLESIFIMAETLQNDVGKPSETDSIQENLKMIANTARSTNQLLGNLLNWALMQIGAFKPSFKEFNLEKCIQKSIEINQTKASRKKIQIHFDSPSIKVHADENMLSIVFRNLIANAINYSNEEDSVCIDIEEFENEVEVSVIDQGIGIPDEIKPQLFDPENRPTRPGTNQEQSTGFGLLICKDVVNMHGGSISVESETGKGSVFTVRLPLKKEQKKVEADYS